MSNYGKGRIFKYRRRVGGRTVEDRTWTLSYYVDGREIREATGLEDRRKAIGLLNDRMSDADKTPVTRSNPTFESVMSILEDDYRLQDKKDALYSLQKKRMKHLKPFFTGKRSREISEKLLVEYQVHRKAEGAKPSTINRELSALHRAFVLAKRLGHVRYVPSFQRLEENNARQGFFDIETTLKIRDELPEHARNLPEVYYITGWRRDEVLSREWSDVDFENGALILWVGEGKDRKVGRTFPLIPDLEAVLKRQREYVSRLEQLLDKKIKWVFPRPDGEQLTYIRDIWAAATKAAGVKGLIHDFRRTAVRNLELAGAPRKAAMAMVGHKTESIYNRYAIADQRMIQAGAEKLTKFLSEEEKRRKRARLRAVK